jgi:hypothetical protein
MTHFGRIQILAVLCLLFTAGSARATTISVFQTQVTVAGGNGSDSYSDIVNNGILVQDGGTFYSPGPASFTTVSSIADLSRGHLGASVASSGLAIGGAQAEFFIDLIVDGVMSTPAMVVMTLHGTLSENTEATAYLGVGNQSDSIACFGTSGGGFCVPQGPITFFFSENTRISAQLFVEGKNGDFLNSADIQIFLPSDVTINDSTGFLRTGQPSPSPVPEPASMLLLGTGLAAAGARYRRERPGRGQP